MKKVLIHFADGFEEIEALAPVDILRRAGCEVTMVSMNGKNEVTSSRGVRIIADKLFHETEYMDADLLVLPGGMPGSKHLDEHLPFHAKLVAHHQQGKFIGAICAAPMVLGHLGLLQNKTVTCYPGMEDEMMGARVTSQPVERDGTILTGKGAGASVEFGLLLVEALLGKTKAEEVKEKMMA